MAAVEGGVRLYVWFLCGIGFRVGLAHQADLGTGQCIRLRGALVFLCHCRWWSIGHNGWVVASTAAGQYADGERETQSQ